MVFWTLLLSSFFVMMLLYFLIGIKRLWIALTIYAVLGIAVVTLFYYVFPGLFTQDLLSFIIPYLVIVPIHSSAKYIISNYVIIDDERVVKYFVAIVNRILNILWSMAFALSIGLLMACYNVYQDGFQASNIWSLSVTSLVLIFFVVAIISLGYKKRFSYILINGSIQKDVYKMVSKKSRIRIAKFLGDDVRIYPRGIYIENGELQYIYYSKEVLNLDASHFEKYDSELFEHLKLGIESSALMEEKYNEYIEEKNSIE